MAEIPTLIVSPRFCGPAGSGNGGYVSGRIASYLTGPVTVTLRRPPPLATAMTVEVDDTVRVRHDGELVAEAVSGGAEPAVPDTATMADAGSPSAYFQDPVFPDCFVCGITRQPGDGLRIFPGPVPGHAVWAARWTPDASLAGSDSIVRPEMVWAALDCPSGIAAGEAAGEPAMVLGRMTTTVAALPAVGDECRVIAWPIDRDGRKLTAGSALLGPGGNVLAAATTVWITVPRPTWEVS